ncbi:hypothetical protein [uncultured Phascolarctobacterium sp.]|uniref:hypothetical protein n=1 Tax=uncultured Phascolarctobacterium sp. TaxID=512296 RepID=UPI00262AED78|nr:hypothetical protein [uncultured Phascolarctobacterium sp.]
MKKIYRYLLLTVLALCLSIPALGAEAASIALLPLINNVQGDEIANQVFYKSAIGAINAQKGFVLVENDNLTAVIDANKNGTNVPGKAQLAKIAKEGKVDIVIAMQIDELEDNPVFPSAERILKLTMEGKAVAYNALTGQYYQHQIYSDKEIDETLTTRWDWVHEEWGYAVRREINRILNVKKVMLDAPRMSKL